MPANAPVMFVLPGETPTASPEFPAELLMVAKAGLDEVHVTELVRSCVLPSPNVPTALYCRPTSTGMLIVVGVTAIDCNAVDSTTTLAVFETEPSVAVMVAAPADWPVA